MNKTFNLDLLRTFTVIAETGSFTTASTRLNSPQSTVSQKLARLEEFTHQRLIDRSHRNIALTPAGEKLLVFAKKMLKINDEALLVMSGITVIYTLRVGLSEDLPMAHITSVLAQFLRSHPNVKFNVTSGISADLQHRYDSGELDLIVIQQKKNGRKGKYKIAENLYWLDSIDTPSVSMTPVPLVSFPARGLYRIDMIENLDEKSLPWRITYTSSSLASVQNAITQGLGISLLPLRNKLPEHKILTEEEGFPVVTDIETAIHFNDDAKHATDIAEIIMDALRRSAEENKSLTESLAQ